MVIICQEGKNCIHYEFIYIYFVLLFLYTFFHSCVYQGSQFKKSNSIAVVCSLIFWSNPSNNRILHIYFCLIRVIHWASFFKTHCLWSLEYADCPPSEGLKTASQKRGSVYDSRSGECREPLHCHYSQFH